MLRMLPKPGESGGSPRWPTETIHVLPLRKRQHVHAHLVTRARTHARILVTARQQKFLTFTQLKSIPLLFKRVFGQVPLPFMSRSLLNEQDFIGILIFLLSLFPKLNQRVMMLHRYCKTMNALQMNSNVAFRAITYFNIR